MLVKGYEPVTLQLRAQIVLPLIHPHEVDRVSVEDGDDLDLVEGRLKHEALVVLAEVDHCLAPDLHLRQLVIQVLAC